VSNIPNELSTSTTFKYDIKSKNCIKKPTIDYLRKKFNKNQRPNKHQINKIASNTNLNSKQVSIWFIKQRLNQRKYSAIKSPKTKLNKNDGLITGSEKFKLTTKKALFDEKITKSLLDEYDENKYPDKQSKERIASKVGLTSQQVIDWFENRRKKLNETKENRFHAKITKSLLKEFEKNKYPDKQSVDRIALKVNVTANQVKSWYEYTRKKLNESKEKGFDEKITKSLLDEYDKNKYPDKQSVDKVALKVNLTAKQVKTWYENRRKKLNETKEKGFHAKITKSLLKEFEKNKYPDKQFLDRIALKVNLTSTQVKGWYENRRRKLNESKEKGFDEKITKSLLDEYDKNKYLDKKSKERLASKVGLTSKQVQNWFKKRRQRLIRSVV
jgi:hypothetical protein